MGYPAIAVTLPHGAYYVADHWYSSATFLSIVGIVTALVVGAITIWITWVVGVARRRLLYSVKSLTPLIAARTGALQKDLAVQWQDHNLDDPQVISVRLDCRGRKDIRSSDFDDNQPLAFDFNANIVTLLRSSIEKSLITYNDSKAFIGPTLIRKKSVISLDFLLDGTSPRLVCDNPPLVDVDVREQRQDRRSVRSNALILAAVAGFGGALTLFSGVIAGNEQLPLLGVIATGVLTVAVASSVLVLALKPFF